MRSHCPVTSPFPEIRCADFRRRECAFPRSAEEVPTSDVSLFLSNRADCDRPRLLVVQHVQRKLAAAPHPRVPKRLLTPSRRRRGLDNLQLPKGAARPVSRRSPAWTACVHTVKHGAPSSAVFVIRPRRRPCAAHQMRLGFFPPSPAATRTRAHGRSSGLA